MSMFTVINVVIYLLAVVIFCFFANKKQKLLNKKLLAYLNLVKEEEEIRIDLLKHLRHIIQGLINIERLISVEKEKSKLEEQLELEQGRVAITESELESVDLRQKELEELKKELEISNLDVVKELEFLQSQEKDLQNRNDSLKVELNKSLEQIDSLMEALQNSTESIAKLTAAKNELIETQKKCEAINQEISQINNRYMMLKRAYDALDIEYAQLYEKQQMAEESNMNS